MRTARTAAVLPVLLPGTRSYSMPRHVHSGVAVAATGFAAGLAGCTAAALGWLMDGRRGQNYWSGRLSGLLQNQGRPGPVSAVGVLGATVGSSVGVSAGSTAAAVVVATGVAVGTTSVGDAAAAVVVMLSVVVDRAHRGQRTCLQLTHLGSQRKDARGRDAEATDRQPRMPRTRPPSSPFCTPPRFLIISIVLSFLTQAKPSAIDSGDGFTC